MRPNSLDSRLWVYTDEISSLFPQHWSYLFLLQENWISM